MTASRRARRIRRVGCVGPDPRRRHPARRSPAGPGRSLPQVLDQTLANGVRVLAVRRPGVPVVEMRLRMPALCGRPGEQAGTGHGRRAPCSPRPSSPARPSGTASASRPTCSPSVARWRASSDADRLALTGSALADGLAELLRLLAEVLVSATYPDDEVDGERDRVEQEITIARSQPAVLAGRRCWGGCTRRHPYGMELPPPGAVSEVTAARMREMHAGRVSPDGALLTLVGDLDPAEALRPCRGGARRLGGPRRGQAGPGCPGLPGRPPRPGEPARCRADQHPVGRRGAAPQRRALPRAAACQHRLRRVLQLAAGQQHPRGQGLYVLAAQRHRPCGGDVPVHGRCRRRHRGHGPGAAGDVLRTWAYERTAGQRGGARRRAPIRRRDDGADERDVGRPGVGAVGARRKRAAGRLPARAPGGAGAGERRRRPRGGLAGARAGEAGPRPARRRRSGPGRARGARPGAGRRASHRRPGEGRSDAAARAVALRGRPRGGPSPRRRRAGPGLARDTGGCSYSTPTCAQRSTSGRTGRGWCSWSRRASLPTTRTSSGWTRRATRTSPASTRTTPACRAPGCARSARTSTTGTPGCSCTRWRSPAGI